MSDTVERPVDVESLSAYLDGALTTEERADVEAQLAVSATWRDELESLRWTVSLVGRTPNVAPPRSFELPLPVPGAPLGAPVSDAPRPWWANTAWLYGLMRGATAVSVALLLAVVGLDTWQTSQVGSTAATSMSAPAADAPVVAQAPAPAEARKAPAEAPKSAPAPAAGAVQAIPAAPSPFPQSGAPPAGGGGGAGPGAGAGGDASNAPAAGAPVVRPAGTATPSAAAAEAAPFGAPTVGVTSQAQKAAVPTAQLTTFPRAVPTPAPQAGNPYRAAEIGLAVLAAVFGMGAIVLRALMRR